MEWYHCLSIAVHAPLVQWLILFVMTMT